MSMPNTLGFISILGFTGILGLISFIAITLLVNG